MARIQKSELTKLEIIRVASKKFLDNGYHATSLKSISDELEMSTGNLTFYYPTKEHLLAEVVYMLCSFQQHTFEKELAEGISSMLALCFELSAMAVMCEEDEVIKEFYVSAYSSPLSLDIIRKNDTARAKRLFAEYCSDWTDEQFAEAEIIVSGIEFATLMPTNDLVSLETRVDGALENILKVYGIKKDIRRQKIQKVLNTNYRAAGKNMLNEFKEYVEQACSNALIHLLRD